MRPERISPKPLPGKISIVFVPIRLIDDMICSCEPLPSAITQITDITPIIMPSIVKIERSLCAKIEDIDILKLSLKRSKFALNSLFWGKFCSFNSNFSSLFLVSVKISPSFISIMRFAHSAIFGSCVTKIIVCPFSCKFLIISITFMPLLLSSAPVGSSANIISPPLISARAILTLCCCPPLSLFGKFCVLSPSPRSDKISFAFASRTDFSTPA